MMGVSDTDMNNFCTNVGSFGHRVKYGINDLNLTDITELRNLAKLHSEIWQNLPWKNEGRDPDFQCKTWLKNSRTMS